MCTGYLLTILFLHLEECLVVRPENTEDTRKIGAKGNMCVLHISRWGITIALQVCYSILILWARQFNLFISKFIK